MVNKKLQDFMRGFGKPTVIRYGENASTFLERNLKELYDFANACEMDYDFYKTYEGKFMPDSHDFIGVVNLEGEDGQILSCELYLAFEDMVCVAFAGDGEFFTNKEKLPMFFAASQLRSKQFGAFVKFLLLLTKKSWDQSSSIYAGTGRWGEETKENA